METNFARCEWYRAEKAALQMGDTSKSGGMLNGAANVRTLTKVVNDVGYVFAYNYRNDAAPVTFTWQYQLASVIEHKTGGSLPVSGATWSDTLGPYEARIYVVTSQFFPLTVNRIGSGTGTVMSSPSGINCGSVCSAAFGGGAMVTLTATPSAGSAFAGWSGGGGGCTGTGQCVVTVASATTVTAAFDRIFTLSVGLTGSGSGTVTSMPAGITCPATCAAGYPSGTGVTLTANPSAGSVFTGWSGGCSGAGQCSVTLGADTAVTAIFSGRFALTVSVTGPGTVSSRPAGIACPPACTADFETGATVSLGAAAAAHATFSGFSGDCTGTSCTLSMTTARSVGAVFATSIGSTFVDDPLVPRVTVIKAVHVTDLRLAIDQERTRRGLGAFSWTDPVLTPGITVISRLHLVEMRLALNQAYAAASRTSPTYTDPVIAAGSLPVRTVHIQELRAAIRVLQGG